MTQQTKLTRECQVVEIPAGHVIDLPGGTDVTITQSLGGSYTLLVPNRGGLFRLSGQDADAIGMVSEPASKAATTEGSLAPEALDQEVWIVLRTCFDPEIPVNIVDLGLIYQMQLSPVEEGQYRVSIQMTLTAQGCGMGTSIAADAQAKLLALPGVKDADVQIVWDPPWTPERISDEGRALLGLR